MKRRLVTTVLIATLGLAAAPLARATHFDGVAASGSFNPQFSATIGETRASRPGDINFRITAADHEDPSVVTTLKAPGDWQFTFDFIRRGQRSNGTPANSCNDTINNRNNSPDRTGQPGGPTDFSKRTDAFIARAEKIGTAFLAAHATGVSSRPPAPDDPLTFRGDLAFVRYDSATQTATLCLLLKLIVDNTDPEYNAANENAKTFADPVPGSGSDEVESVTELTANFQLVNVGGSWQTIVDLTDLVQSQELQALDVSVVDFRANFLGNTVGNWNTEGSIPFSRTPGTSGSKTFTAIFQTCPQNHPDYLNCKSNKGDGSTATTGGTVTRNVNVNITPAPGITTPLNNAACTDSVGILGTADPGTLVRVSEIVGGSPVTIADVTADLNGRWSLRQPFAAGTHTIRASQITPPGPDSEDITFTVSLPAPAIASPTSGALVEPGATPLNGTAPAGTRSVVVYNGATNVGTGASDDLGNWTATASLAPHQTVTLAVRALNLCGEGALSPSVTVDVNTTQPTITSPASGANLNDDTPTVTGTADPGAVVTVSNGGPVGTTTAGPGGTWVVDLSPLTEGINVLTATATFGTFTSLPSASLSVNIDLTAPNAPVILSPADGSTLEPLITFTGTAEPNARVRLYESGVQVGPTGTATGAGTWSIQAVLDIGARSVIARATDLAGNVSGDSAAVNLTIIDPLKILSPAEGTSHPAKVPFNIETSPAAVEVIVYEGGVEVARRAVANRRFIGQITFAGGEHTITVRTRAADNSLSNETQPRLFKVDAVQPTVIVNSIAGSGLNLLNPQLTGTATDSAPFDTGVARIELTYRGRTGGVFSQRANCPLCTAGTVAWNATPSNVINMPGVYDAFITAFDAVGNASQIGRTTFVITS
jgi:hypothetical protein